MKTPSIKAVSLQIIEKMKKASRVEPPFRHCYFHTIYLLLCQEKPFYLYVLARYLARSFNLFEANSNPNSFPTAELGIWMISYFICATLVKELFLNSILSLLLLIEFGKNRISQSNCSR